MKNKVFFMCGNCKERPCTCVKETMEERAVRTGKLRFERENQPAVTFKSVIIDYKKEKRLAIEVTDNRIIPTTINLVCASENGGYEAENCTFVKTTMDSIVKLLNDTIKVSLYEKYRKGGGNL
jgi:hypothetical protein